MSALAKSRGGVAFCLVRSLLAPSAYMLRAIQVSKQRGAKNDGVFVWWWERKREAYYQSEFDSIVFVCFLF